MLIAHGLSMTFSLHNTKDKQQKKSMRINAFTQYIIVLTAKYIN